MTKKMKEFEATLWDKMEIYFWMTTLGLKNPSDVLIYAIIYNNVTISLEALKAIYYGFTKQQSLVHLRDAIERLLAAGLIHEVDVDGALGFECDIDVINDSEGFWG